MPTDLQQQEQRRSAIRQLLRANVIRTQSELVERLHALGHLVTQSSVSRDLREMQVIKDPDGYHLASGTTAENGNSSLDFIREIASAGAHLLVVKTAIGAAQRVAFELDRSNWPEIVGTISGDDTIFIATQGQAATRRLASRLQAVAGEPQHG